MLPWFFLVNVDVGGSENWLASRFSAEPSRVIYFTLKESPAARPYVGPAVEHTPSHVDDFGQTVFRMRTGREGGGKKKRSDGPASKIRGKYRGN